MLRRLHSWVWCAAALAVGTSALGAARPLGEQIRAAAAAVRPAVVSIEVKGRQAAQGIPQLPNVPFVVPRQPGQERRFEFHWPPRNGEQPNLQPFPDPIRLFQLAGQASRGTGVIVAVDGDRALVAAPASLLRGANEVFVTLPDGRELAAKVAGVDAFSGTGCLELRGAKLEGARVGDPAKLAVGDWVLAVGGPATGGALTAGIVSTKGRLGKGALAGIVVLESDVALGEGMEGGPLVNLDGEVVGMTVGASGRWGRGRELTTVVPSSTVLENVRALGKDGKVRRGFLGVRYGPLEQADRERFGLRHGVKVQDVVPGSPAADAGFQAGDVILEFGGAPVVDTMAFRAMVAGRKPGTRVAVKLSRGGEEINTEVALGEMPEEMAAPRPPRQPRPVEPEPALPAGEKLDIGVSLQPLTAELAEHFGFAGKKGLLVTAVDAKGAAAKARPRPIQQGELVTEVGRTPVATVAEAKAAIAEAGEAGKKTLLLLVRSKEGVRYTVVDLAQ